MIACESRMPTTSLDGHWEGAWQFADGSYVEKFSFDLTQSGITVVGSGLDEKGVTAKVSEKIEDLSFTLVVVPEDGADPIVFSGQKVNKSIRGVWRVGTTTGPWAAEKR